MNVTFPNVPHVGYVYLASFAPTRMTVVSTGVAILVISAFFAAIGAFYLSVCMGKPFSLRKTVTSFFLVVFFVCALGYGTRAWTGERSVPNSLALPTSADAIEVARANLPASHGFIPKAKRVPATGQKLQEAWTTPNLQLLYAEVAKAKGMKAASPTSVVAIDTNNNWTTSEIALHGSTFIKDGKPIRCVIKVSNVRRNNAGQPLSATVSNVACAEPAPAVA